MCLSPFTLCSPDQTASPVWCGRLNGNKTQMGVFAHIVPFRVFGEEFLVDSAAIWLVAGSMEISLSAVR